MNEATEFESVDEYASALVSCLSECGLSMAQAVHYAAPSGLHFATTEKHWKARRSIDEAVRYELLGPLDTRS